MIPFDEIDNRLKELGKDRAWLADETSRSPDSLRAALAPKAKPKNRSSLLQKALTDAIVREEERQAAPPIPVAPVPALDRVTVECTEEERRAWQQAALDEELTLDPWIIDTLNKAARKSAGNSVEKTA